jgi:hypothetical protein
MSLEKRTPLKRKKRPNFPPPETPWFLICVLIIFVTLFSLPNQAPAAEKNYPFGPGEKLTMKVRWGVIPAGEATLEVMPHIMMNGTKMRHFVLKVKTTPFVDLFYKVRDRIDSFADMKMTRSTLYKKTKQGKKKKDIIVHFDWDKRQARYSNLLRKGKRRHREPISIPPGTFDPMTVFYAFRLQDLEKENELVSPVTDGKKCVVGKARIVAREKIRLANRTFDTFLVEPDLRHLEGIFDQSRDSTLKIWVTADERRIPVRIESKVIVGSFIGELSSVENNGKVEFFSEKGPK